MFNKPSTSATQAAYLLLFIIVLASSTFGNPFYKREDSATKKIVDFNVHVSESGEEYNEKIEVDTDKQTELFQVPAHPGVDRSDVLHDFKQKLTMLRFPDTDTCYLFPLPKEQPIPEKLIKDLEKAEQKVITESKRMDSTWIVHGEVNERSFLSDDLQKFCANYPIYLVKKAQDSLVATRIQTGETTKRQRRQYGPLRRPKCAGGMTQDEALIYCYKPDLKCKVSGRVCYKYLYCKVGGKDEIKPIALSPPIMASMSSTGSDNCLEFHDWVNVVCCEYVCR